jgi:dinuclear metal center YbgI/SA1388 family protein
MKISEVIRALEVFAAPELQEDYDNAGLLTGNAADECTGVLCCLDVTMDVLEEARTKNCNLVVAHHPIIFKGLKRLNGKNYVEQVIIQSIRTGIAIYACHTNLDNVVMGVNAKFAEALGLKNTRILAPRPKMLKRLITFAPHDHAETVRTAVFKAGAGHIGKYSECSFNSRGTGTFKAEQGADPFVGEIGEQHREEETKIEIVFPFYLETQVVKALVDAHPYEEVAYDIFTMDNVHFGIGAGVIGELKKPVKEKDFLSLIKTAFKVPVVRHTALAGKEVQKVAICGGAGSFLVRNALTAGADFFISSDIKYHEFFDADGKMVIADIGHYESEQFTIELLHDLIAKKFPTFAVLKTTVNTNPIRYFI